MQYMTLAKTLYKSALFLIIVAAVFFMALPSEKVFAAYPTNTAGSTGTYSTMTGGPTGNRWNTAGGNMGGSQGGYQSGSQSQNYGTQGGYVGNPNYGPIQPDSLAVVSTEPALNITKSSALIQGAAHVDSGYATVWFEWGTRVDRLEYSTRSVRIDNQSTGYAETLTNLKPGTKYYYRIVARNSAGTCYGKIRSFTTAGGTVVAKTKTAKASEADGYAVSTSSSSSSSGSSTDRDIKGNLSAAAANAEGSRNFAPTSVVGWLIVIALVFLIAVVVRMIQRENEERKKREEAKKKLEEAQAKA